jgi:hypothetical protein
MRQTKEPDPSSNYESYDDMPMAGNTTKLSKQKAERAVTLPARIVLKRKKNLGETLSPDQHFSPLCAYADDFSPMVSQNTRFFSCPV